MFNFGHYKRTLLRTGLLYSNCLPAQCFLFILSYFIHTWIMDWVYRGSPPKGNFIKLNLFRTIWIRMICRASKFDSCGKLYKKLNLLKLKDLFFMKIVNSTWDYDNGFLPTCFNNYFLHTRTIHHYETRFSISNKITKTRNYTSSRYGLNSFSNVAIDVSNKIKYFSWYTQVNIKSYEFEIERHSAWILLKILWLQNLEAAKPAFIFLWIHIFEQNHNSSAAIRLNKDTIFQLFLLFGCTFPMIYICFFCWYKYLWLSWNKFCSVLYKELFWPFCKLMRD